MTGLLRARNLGYSIDGRALVADCDLDVPAGELAVVVGPNGAGKTTLLRLLTGELRPTRGVVRYDRQDVATLSAARLSGKRAVMTQAQSLSFPFTVLDVVRLGLDGGSRGGLRERGERILENALLDADVLHLAGRDFQSLSGGEQQRVQFARVTAQLESGRALDRRQILFLDEPVSSLDLNHQLALMDSARRIAGSGAAVVAILHDLNLAVTYAQRLVVMSGGRIVAQGRPGEVLTQDLLTSVFKVDLKLHRHDGHGLPCVVPQGRALA